MARAEGRRDRPAPLAEHGIAVVARWTARTIGIPLFGLVVVLVFPDGVRNPLTGSLRENLLNIVVLVTFSGFILAWKWEGLGGLLVLFGLALFATVNYWFLLNIVLVPWLATGLLYAFCWVGDAGRVMCNHAAGEEKGDRRAPRGPFPWVVQPHQHAVEVKTGTQLVLAV